MTQQKIDNPPPTEIKIPKLQQERKKLELQLELKRIVANKEIELKLIEANKEIEIKRIEANKAITIEQERTKWKQMDCVQIFVSSNKRLRKNTGSSTTSLTEQIWIHPTVNYQPKSRGTTKKTYSSEYRINYIFCKRASMNQL